MGTGIALGAALGIAFGVLFMNDQIAVPLSIGAALGIVLGMIADTLKGKIVYALAGIAFGQPEPSLG